MARGRVLGPAFPFPSAIISAPTIIQLTACDNGGTSSGKTDGCRARSQVHGPQITPVARENRQTRYCREARLVARRSGELHIYHQTPTGYRSRERQRRCNEF